MANFKKVNKAVSKALPKWEGEVYRGEGYVYFSDLDIPSVYVHPVSTLTEDVIRLVIDEIKLHYNWI